MNVMMMEMEEEEEAIFHVFNNLKLFFNNKKYKVNVFLKKTNGRDHFDKQGVTYGTKLRQFKVKGPK